MQPTRGPSIVVAPLRSTACVGVVIVLIDPVMDSDGTRTGWRVTNLEVDRGRDTRGAASAAGLVPCRGCGTVISPRVARSAANPGEHEGAAPDPARAVRPGAP